MRRTPPLTDSPRTIDAFAVVAGLAVANLAVSLLTWPTGRERAFGVISLALLVVGIVVYLIRRIRSDRTWTAWALLLVAAGCWALLTGPLTLLAVALAVLLLHLDYGLQGAVLGATLTMLAFVVAAPTLHDTQGTEILVELVVIGILLAAIVWLTGVIAMALRRQQEARELSAERDRVLGELASAHRALAGSLEKEKDLVLAQERARAAGELHDGLGHRLTAIRLGLDFADRVWERDPEGAREEVRTARDATVDALQEMRIWVRALNPGSHATLTDAASFDAIADTFRGTGLDVHVETDGLDAPLSPEVSLFAHRFIQEGLTNAVRHGGASEVRIEVVQSKDGLRMSLRDNGSGHEGAGEAGEGFGLRSLRERAEGLNGSFASTGREDGFTIEAWIPAEGTA